MNECPNYRLRREILSFKRMNSSGKGSALGVSVQIRGVEVSLTSDLVRNVTGALGRYT